MTWTLWSPKQGDSYVVKKDLVYTYKRKLDIDEVFVVCGVSGRMRGCRQTTRINVLTSNSGAASMNLKELVNAFHEERITRL